MTDMILRMKEKENKEDVRVKHRKLDAIMKINFFSFDCKDPIYLDTIFHRLSLSLSHLFSGSFCLKLLQF